MIARSFCSIPEKPYNHILRILHESSANNTRHVRFMIDKIETETGKKKKKKKKTQNLIILPLEAKAITGNRNSSTRCNAALLYNTTKADAKNRSTRRHHQLQDTNPASNRTHIPRMSSLLSSQAARVKLNIAKVQKKQPE